jgi:hypothetical protein
MCLLVRISSVRRKLRVRIHSSQRVNQKNTATNRPALPVCLRSRYFLNLRSGHVNILPKRNEADLVIPAITSDISSSLS